MIDELTSAQQELWLRAEEAMEHQRTKDVLFLTQALLRVAPEFLAARRLARQAALQAIQKKSPGLFKKIKISIENFFLRYRVSLLMKKERFAEALVLLENFLAQAPHDCAMNRLMATVAERWNPPLHSLALFALETAAMAQPEMIILQLEIARVALLPDEVGTSWNPERALKSYQYILARDPNHLKARQGMKNASALLLMRNDFFGKEISSGTTSFKGTLNKL